MLGTPRGMRDFMPAQMNARKKVVSVVEAVFGRYGYEPLETPALELMDVLNSKCGEDTDKQIYRVEGGTLGMRFDLTVPLARVVAGNQSIPKPFKRYCIGRVWRREEPQKGRFREFLQADVDVVGSARMECEAELIACACECLEALGFREFSVRLNNRKVLDAIIRGLGVDSKPEAVFRAVDKFEKIGTEGVRRELRDAGVGENQAGELLKIINGGGSNEKILEVLEGRFKNEGIAELREILRLCGLYGVDNVSVDMSLVRGLDYYTGPVFEIKAGGGVGSIAGGGRYDDLISSYGGGSVPAVGISLGIERIMAILNEKAEGSSVELYIAAVKEEFYPKAIEVAKELRAEGLRVQVDLMGRNLRKQLDYANSSGIKFVGIIGKREVEKGQVTLRNLETGEERMLPASGMAKAIRGVE